MAMLIFEKASLDYVILETGLGGRLDATNAVESKELENRTSRSLTNMLQGSVPGLNITTSSGTPGSGSSIIIRGLGSISASQSPLIVVDGVPYEGSLNSIPTQDIESLTVLKDAAANSMYGARGSNGVIIITTKRGAADKIHVTFDAKVGVNSRAVPAYDVITNPGDYYEMAWESLRNAAYYRDASPLTLAQANMYASAALIPNLNYNTYKGIADNELIDPATGKELFIKKDGTYSFTVPNNVSEVVIVIKGDVTDNNVIDSTDYMRIKSYFLGTHTLSELALFTADVNDDGRIDSTDYIQIKGYFLDMYDLR